MNDTIKEWLKELYGDAIKEAKETICNERLLANGAESEEAAQRHLDNVALQEEYIEVLQTRLDEVNHPEATDSAADDEVLPPAKQDLNTDGMTGYLLEYFDELTGKWEQSELANPFNVRYYGFTDAEHDWEKDEVQIGMFANYPTAWGDMAGDDWPDRLGVAFDWKHPAECVGVMTEWNKSKYRVRKVALGPFSEKFLEFCKRHPYVEVAKEYTTLGE